MSKSIETNGLFMENMYRPIYEIQSSYAWAGASLFTAGSWVYHGVSGHDVSMVAVSVIAATAGMSVKRLKEALPQIRRQIKLVYNYQYLIESSALWDLSKTQRDKAFFGRGFEWTITEANRAYQLVGKRPEHAKGFLPWAVRRALKKVEADTEKLEGRPWIQGCGDEQDLWLDASLFWSHSFYTGLPGAGKTTMLTLNSVGALYRGNSVLVLDPKNDPNWKNRLRAEAKRLGVPFYYFNIAEPSQSVRIDPLVNFTVTTEIASRLANVLEKGSGSSEGFRSYAWDSFYVTAEALRFIGKRPSIKMVADYMLNRKSELALAALSKIMTMHYGPDWYANMATQIAEEGRGSLLQGLIMRYQQVLIPDDKGEDAVSSFIGFLTHDQSHQSKMLATTKPMLTQLTAAPLDKMLSPDPNDTDDERPIIDIKKFIDTGGVLYIATDSSGNPAISAAVSKLIMEDTCAAAASRYNYEGGKGVRVSVFGDEIHSALSDGLINLAAMGRGAGFELHLSTQGVPDLIDKAGDAVASRVLSLTANWFCLRARDDITRERFAALLPEYPIKSKQWQLSSNTDSTSKLHNYSGSVGERIMEADKPAYPLSLMSELPKLQYVARLANGKTYQCRIPILL
ncbi:conjugative transfer system coupling protein TraD [Shewanella xiamenensis]|uniref:conjugative transfer system coupling protein TraD n=1 Tax=Shewanella xiamenensis TaxID=332186 RepID=UPI001CC6E96E|nr:conjugative transfer system coupling protein TraD [Shewanella xiamenensis]